MRCIRWLLTLPPRKEPSLFPQPDRCSPEKGAVPVLQYAGLRGALDWPGRGTYMGRVVEKSITYIGLDVHKNTVAPAVQRKTAW
jgi:hypothetical protein